MSDSKYQVRTTRQVITDMLRDGYTPAEMAGNLNLTRQTVKYHLDQIELGRLRIAK